MTRAALYLRVSTARQADDGYGLSYQEDQLRDWAAQNGYNVIEAITEPGFSRDELNRPGLDRIRELAGDGRIDVVLAWRRDRYGEPTVRAIVEYELSMYGVRLKAMDDSGGDSPEDEFTDSIKDGLTKLEKAKIRERTRSGTLQKVKDGKIIMGPHVNLGFKPNQTRNGYLVDEKTMPVVRRIFELINVKGSVNGTMTALHDAGIKSPTGKDWSHTVIRKIVLNDVYRPHSYEEVAALVTPQVAATLDPNKRYGLWWYNRRNVKRWREAGTYQRKTKASFRDPEQWLAVPVPDAGIDRGLIDSARRLVLNNVKNSNAGRRECWELSNGILRCGECGRPMVARTAARGTRDDFYYVCQSYRKGGCSHRTHYRAGSVEETVARMLAVWFRDIDRVEAYVEERIDQERRKLFAGDPESQAKALTAQIVKLDRKAERYKEEYAEDIIQTMAELKGKLAALDDQRRTARTELDKLMNRRQYLDDLERDKKLVLSFYAGYMAAGLDKISPQQRQNTYRRLRLRVTLSPGGIVNVDGQPDANYLPEPAELEGWQPWSQSRNYASV